MGDEILTALGERCDVFEDVPVPYVIESREKGAKCLKTLGLKRSKVVIFDDSLNGCRRTRSSSSKRCGMMCKPSPGS